MKPILLPALVLALGLAPLFAADPVDVSVDKAAELLAAGEKVTILDIRTPEEFADGHLKDAVNVDFTGDDFESSISKLDPAKPYLVHCAAGGRSGRSMELFKKLKFAKIYHLVDGYNGWADAGKPVTK
ncbi:MAG: rhodanese-like domain-containing protein [Verrucomicrobiae bacterium]|nr:rhodanese-like domain-containing protein [Verrucomicrobiae bacterium]